MLSRRSLLAGLGGLWLVFVLTACQALPLRASVPTAIAQPTASGSTMTSNADNVVWARVPFCSCLDGTATDLVSASLKKAQLEATVKLLSPTNGWMYFEVAFDPEAASHDQIAAAIKAGGGEVLAGPP